MIPTLDWELFFMITCVSWIQLVFRYFWIDEKFAAFFLYTLLNAVIDSLLLFSRISHHVLQRQNWSTVSFYPSNSVDSDADQVWQLFSPVRGHLHYLIPHSAQKTTIKPHPHKEATLTQCWLSTLGCIKHHLCYLLLLCTRKKKKIKIGQERAQKEKRKR